MAAAFCWACYSIVVRRHGLDAVRATIAITVFALLSYVPVYSLLVAGGWVASRIGSAPWGELAFQMLFQGIGSVVVSGITFTKMVQHFGPVRTTMITALVPGLSALGAVLWLDEPLYWNLIAGLLLVTAGILFGVQKPAPARAAGLGVAMPDVLAFDTSTEQLSIAVRRGERVWTHEGAGGAQSSATLIPLIQQLLAE
eukprot:gene38657-43811_t